MKLDKVVLANAFALSTAILWVLCSAFVVALPRLSTKITEWWMHGMSIESWQLTWANFFLGGVTLVIAMWISGYVFGWAWEYVSKK